MILTRRMIVDTIWHRTGWKRKQAELMVDMVLLQLRDALGMGNDVNLVELGKFTVRKTEWEMQDFKNHRRVRTEWYKLRFKPSRAVRFRLKLLMSKTSPMGDKPHPEVRKACSRRPQSQVIL